MLCIFHLGRIIPAAFGVFGLESWANSPSAKWLEYAGWYTTLALASIGIGTSIGCFLKQSRFPNKKIKFSSDKTLSVAYWSGIGLFFAAGIFFGMLIYSVGNLLNISRLDFFSGSVKSRGLGTFLWVFPGAATLMIIGAQNKIQKITAFSLASIGFFVILFSGYRSTAFVPILVGVVLWVKTGHKLSKFLAVTMVVFVVVAIPVIGKLRALGSYGEISQEKIEKTLQKSKTEKGIVEMGSSVGVLAEVLRLTPKTDPFRYGYTYIIAIKNSIPNLGTSISEGDRKMALKANLTKNALFELPPSDLITLRLFPDKFRNGEGVGYSAIAEPYINFGLTGVIFYFCLLGYLFYKFDSKNILYHPKLLIFSGSIYWCFVRTVRNDIGNFIKPMVFIIIILTIWRYSTKLFPIFRVPWR